jgi:hypothetical protein
LALPAEPALLDRLLTELALQADPPISVGRSATAVLAFDCDTWDGMLRSRVVQALEAAFGRRPAADRASLDGLSARPS